MHLTCGVEGCDKPKVARGWCGMHYARWQRLGDVGAERGKYVRRHPAAPKPAKTERGHPRACMIEGCGKPVIARGWCHAHYKKWQLYGDPLEDRTRTKRTAPCSVEGCERDTLARGWCGMHYARWKKHRDVHRGAPPGWGTEPKVGKQGYVFVTMPGHPNAWANGALYQHVVVMTEILGRPLTKGETVHHKNGVRHDNRPENLELWVKAHPPGQRVSELIAFAHEIIERYADDMQLWPEHLRP